jgi:hypothetical protein
VIKKFSIHLKSFFHEKISLSQFFHFLKYLSKIFSIFSDSIFFSNSSFFQITCFFELGILIGISKEYFQFLSEDSQIFIDQKIHQISKDLCPIDHHCKLNHSNSFSISSGNHISILKNQLLFKVSIILKVLH